MNEIIESIVGIAALILLVPFWNRVRVLQWGTHQARVVLMYLCCTLWIGWQFGSRLLPEIGPWLGALWLPDLFDFLGLIGMTMLISTTRSTWRQGAPGHVYSMPAAFDSRPHEITHGPAS